MSVVAAEVSKWALRNVSFELPPGSVTAMVGANGSGKSTLLNVLAGHLPPDSGHSSIAGRVAYVPQHKPMYRSFKVADVLQFGRRMNDVWDDERADEWLTRFKVPRRLQIGDLSGGQRTHVTLALALGSRPDVMLLDEPLSELDPLARHKVMRELLTEVNDKGMTLVFSTHVVAEIGGVADRLLLLSGGRLLVNGDTDELLEEHVLYTGPHASKSPVEGPVVLAKHGRSQSSYLVRSGGTRIDEPWTARYVTLEELVVAHLERAA
ncbi:ABC-2 type transport system ATP-binding protein [Lentzea albidocapillata subsp. violacea]|uniref:ABC-2 type transport system ATP-binding protein n=1 Tax=Lentzea albidocapillata subsp. violacea TaxID=128104 RepID=A0A1G8WKL8_9PSEU|nr:ABC transporter ATP-binding protein [Lentzea albidocapillata]SDJ78918.1 ABC-2 type transport system ATP-binding protein [Lentzea albidocapillata subsp. violacea]